MFLLNLPGRCCHLRARNLERTVEVPHTRLRPIVVRRLADGRLDAVTSCVHTLSIKEQTLSAITPSSGIPRLGASASLPAAREPISRRLNEHAFQTAFDTIKSLLYQAEPLANLEEKLERLERAQSLSSQYIGLLNNELLQTKLGVGKQRLETRYRELCYQALLIDQYHRWVLWQQKKTSANEPDGAPVQIERHDWPTLLDWYRKLDAVVNSQLSNLQRALDSYPSRMRKNPTYQALINEVNEHKLDLVTVVAELEQKLLDCAVLPDNGWEKAAVVYQAALDANRLRFKAVPDVPGKNYRASVEIDNWEISTRLSECHRQHVCDVLQAFWSLVNDFANAEDSNLNGKGDQEILQAQDKMHQIVDAALAHEAITNVLHQTMCAMRDNPPDRDIAEAFSPDMRYTLDWWGKHICDATMIQVDRAFMVAIAAHSYLKRKAYEGTTQLHDSLKVLANDYERELQLLSISLEMLILPPSEGLPAMSGDPYQELQTEISLAQRFEEEILSVEPRYRPLFGTGGAPVQHFTSLRNALSDLQNIMTMQLEKVQRIPMATAAQSDPPIRATSKHRRTVGRRQKRRGAIANAGFSKSFAAPQRSSWKMAFQQEESVENDDDTLVDNDDEQSGDDDEMDAASAPIPKPVADAGKGLGRLEAAIVRHEQTAQANADLRAFLVKSQTAASFGELALHLNGAIAASNAMLRKLGNLRPHLTPLGAEAMSRVASLEAKLKREILDLELETMQAAKTPPCSEKALVYLLEKQQVLSVTLSKDRILLKGTDSRLPGGNTKSNDFMDEHMIHIADMHTPLYLHTHYSAPTAALDEKTASHLKFEVEGITVRKAVSLETLKKIYDLSTTPHRLDLSDAAQQVQPPTSPTPLRKSKALTTESQQASAASTPPAGKKKRRSKKTNNAAV